ncbi:hypothetical protein BUALT_BualtUnG0001400 [Buddleja alternifolia]|uniref:Uncharacterized protein n=1 Tax=Buddleja alternifolia TaxID=168488 RepID=A0AAV6W7U3_9LAMI|nr:hypothetical protein BUALT_BualtUnG0001400 [Buddleja alternifolia]
MKDYGPLEYRIPAGWKKNLSFSKFARKLMEEKKPQEIHVKSSSRRVEKPKKQRLGVPLKNLAVGFCNVNYDGVAATRSDGGGDGSVGGREFRCQHQRKGLRVSILAEVEPEEGKEVLRNKPNRCRGGALRKRKL